MDFPPDSLPGVSKIELFGSSEATVSPCMGIIRYSDEEITVRVAEGKVRVSGRGLVMRSCNNMTLRISGDIRSVTTAGGMKG